MDMIHSIYLVLLVMELMLTICVVIVSVQMIRDGKKMENTIEKEVDYEEYLKWKKEQGLR